MVRLTIRFVVLMALYGGFALAEPGPWTPLGPTDIGWIFDVAVGDDAVYAATFNGVYRSSDGGATWEPAGLQGNLVEEVATHPGTSAVFARPAVWINQGFPGKHGYTWGPVLVSQDRGATWTYIDEEFQAYGFVSAIALDPSEPETVYVASGLLQSELWRSSDGGTTWTPSASILPTIRVLAVDHARGLIYAATDGFIAKSADGGATWSEIVSPLPDASLCGRDACPGAVAVGGTGSLYAGQEGVFCRSTDAAVTWSCADVPGYPRKIVELPPSATGSPARILVASDSGLFASDDGGVTWSTLEGPPGFAAQSQALASDPAGTLVIAGTDCGAYRSADGGRTWTAGSEGLQALWPRVVALDPTDPAKLWMGGAGFSGSTGPGLFQSSDGGASWTPASGVDGPRRVDALAIDPRDPSTLYAGGEAVYRTDDGGEHWTRSVPPRGDPVRALAVDPFDSSHVLVGTGGGDFQGFMDDATGGRLFVSEDAGRTWTARGPDREIYSLLFDHRRPGKIYASSYWDLSDSWYYPDINGGSIWVSDDDGVSWFSRTVTPLESYPSSFALDPHEDGVVYAALVGNQIYRSADYGASWTKWSEVQGVGGLHTIVADPVRAGHWFVSSNFGVYESSDGGRTWGGLESQTPNSPWPLAISPDGGRLYAGAAGSGVYRMDRRVASFPCVPTQTQMCLVGNRYALRVAASRRGELLEAGEAHSLADNAGYFTLGFATGDSELPEVVVEMLPEGTFGPGAPIFFSSMTTMPFTLTVTDTTTGLVEAYHNEPEAPLCGGVDLAFGDASPVPAAMRAAPAPVNAGLELLAGRFELTLTARETGTGRTTTGQPVPRNDRFGYFSFPEVTGDAEFPEVFVKMLDFRWITGGFVLFHAGLTGFDYTLTVTDKVAGTVRTVESLADYCGAVVTLSPSP